MSFFLLLTFSFFPNKTETIKISLKHPEHVPYPFKVYTSDKLKGVEPNTRYQGYIIVMRVHPCDVLGQGKGHEPFTFKAHHFNAKEIVVEVPVLDYTDMGKDDDYVRQLYDDDDDDDDGSSQDGSQEDSGDEEKRLKREHYVLMEALDNGRNKLNDRVNNKEFPIKKQYRIVFEDDVDLSAEVLKVHEAFKDSSRLTLRPLPIEYVLQTMQEQYMDDLTWEDVETLNFSLPKDDEAGMRETKEVHVLAQKLMVVTRFCIELADLNKEHRKRGRIVTKSTYVSGAEAMMAAMSIKKKKKKKGKATS
jgi:hypothetical protein